MSQFVPIDPKRPEHFVGWYSGEVLDCIGTVKPPPSHGFDGVLLFFWLSYFAGYLAIAAWIIYWIWS